MDIDDARQAIRNRQIHAEIRACPHSMTCDQPGCQVITQGGYKGAAAHMATCHPEVNYARPGGGTEIS